MDAWVVEVLREGYRILFLRRPPLSDQPLPMPSYTPSSIRGKALEQEFQDLLHKQAIEQAPQTPGFYSRLFVVQKDSSSDPSGIASVSSLHHERSPIPVQGAVLWADNWPSGLYKADGSNICHSPSLRYQDAKISR